MRFINTLGVNLLTNSVNHQQNIVPSCFNVKLLGRCISVIVSMKLFKYILFEF